LAVDGADRFAAREAGEQIRSGVAPGDDPLARSLEVGGEGEGLVAGAYRQPVLAADPLEFGHRDRHPAVATSQRQAFRAAGVDEGEAVRRLGRPDQRRLRAKRRRLDGTIFAVGELVKVTGTTKGRGFQGVVKRHGFHGGPNTHGNTKHRKPGSIGAGTDPSRVIKGKKMPGQYGNVRHTAIGIRIEKIDAERNLIYLRGSVAGPTNGIVFVRKQGRS